MAQHGYLREYDEDFERGGDRQRERGLMFGGEAERIAPSPPDAHYLSWREKHMRELDRDYDEYRREREQMFHRDFEGWRQQRHANPQPLQPGMTQSGLSDTTGTLELTSPSAVQSTPEPDPMATATLGTTSSGRSRR